MKVDWAPPKPRKGLAGHWDRFVGPGTTKTELGLVLAAAFTFGIFIPFYALINDLGWSIVQLLVAGLLAFDIMGGIIANASSPAKRWYHRKGMGFPRHFRFILFHGVQIFLVAWLFQEMDLIYFGFFYSYLVLAALIILLIPLHLKRPSAMALFCGAILLSIYAAPMIPGMEWFLPFLFLKLIICYLLKETPYRPENKVKKI